MRISRGPGKDLMDRMGMPVTSPRAPARHPQHRNAAQVEERTSTSARLAQYDDG